MTSRDYIVTMKRIGVAELKARLSEYLRYVRRGYSVTVLDRGTPIARVVPYDAAEPLRVRVPSRAAGALRNVPLPPALRLKVDVLELLMRERQPER